MSTVWRWLSRLLLVLLFLVASLAAVWTYGRLTSPTAEQQAAIAVMQADEPGEGENGFDLLMAHGTRPPGDPPAALRCDENSACIAAIEAAPEASAAAIEAWTPALEAVARALHAPVFRDRRTAFPAGQDLPGFQMLTHLDSFRAFQFSTGRTEAALAAACDDARGAARWVANPDTLVQAMVGSVVFHQQAALIADMRQRARQDALPPSCVALSEAPDPAVEGLLCAALRGEWRWQRRTLWPQLESELERNGHGMYAKLLHDAGWSLAHTAESYAAACGDAAREAARGDRAIPLLSAEIRWVDRVAYPLTASLVGIGLPGYTDYQERQLDYVAMRRLLAAFLQMEAMDAGLSNAKRFAALPAALREGPRSLVFDAAEGSIAVPLRSRRYEQGGNVMRLRLPERAEAQDVSAPEPSMPR
jgi:hypothetical protein